MEELQVYIKYGHECLSSTMVVYPKVLSIKKKKEIISVNRTTKVGNEMLVCQNEDTEQHILILRCVFELNSTSSTSDVFFMCKSKVKLSQMCKYHYQWRN